MRGWGQTTHLNINEEFEEALAKADGIAVHSAGVLRNALQHLKERLEHGKHKQVLLQRNFLCMG